MTTAVRRSLPSALTTALTCAVLAATATAGLVATGGAASAATTTVSDPVGDPLRFDGEDEDQSGTSAPGATKVDVTGVRFDYRTRFLVVVGRAEGAGRATMSFVRVKRAGVDTYFNSTRQGGIASDDGGRCAAGTSSFDADTGRYRMRIPASCFGSPDQARLGFALLRGRGNAGGAIVVDVAGRDGYDPDSEIRLGPSVARG